MFKAKYLIIGFIIIILDLCIYLLLGLLLMGYDDNYDASKGEYWSLESMTKKEQVIYLSFQLWNIINLVAVGYIFFKMIKNIYSRRISRK